MAIAGPVYCIKRHGTVHVSKSISRHRYNILRFTLQAPLSIMNGRRHAITLSGTDLTTYSMNCKATLESVKAWQSGHPGVTARGYVRNGSQADRTIPINVTGFRSLLEAEPAVTAYLRTLTNDNGIISGALISEPEDAARTMAELLGRGTDLDNLVLQYPTGKDSGRHICSGRSEGKCNTEGHFAWRVDGLIRYLKDANASCNTWNRYTSPSGEASGGM
jgi:hypothetical protein